MIIAKSKLNWVSDSNPTYCNFEADTSLLYYLFSMFCKTWHPFQTWATLRGWNFLYSLLAGLESVFISLLLFSFSQLIFNLAVKFVLKKGVSLQALSQYNNYWKLMLNEFVLARKTKTARSKYQLKARLSRQNWVHLQKITDQGNKGLGSCFYLLYKKFCNTKLIDRLRSL